MSAAVKPTKTTKKVVKSSHLHPPYLDMAVAAVAALKERKGSSKIAIGKFIAANYKLGGDLNNNALKGAVKTGVVKGILLQVKGTGAAGSFKLAAKKVEKKPKKPAAKKPAAKKAKKPAAKAAAKKKTVASKKKPTPKKAAKSPAKKKKTPSKKSPKKATKKATPKKKK